MASPPRRAPGVAFVPNLIGIRTTARVALNCTRSHPRGLPTVAFTLNLIRIREYHALPVFMSRTGADAVPVVHPGRPLLLPLHLT
jgi:hypothetical protein